MKTMLAALVFFSLAVPVAFAHSVVSPSQTLTSKYENFSLGVPSEKNSATIDVRLLVPDRLDNVMPFVKPGWKIVVSKNSAGKVTQIEWSGGSIPAGEKDIFLFTARTPQTPTELVWKAYQTYADGEVIAWDQNPMNGATKSANPYSVTDVVADTPVEPAATHGSSLPLVTAIAALVVALAALAFSVRTPV